uniref:Uncharacterized protein n=1 Tax=Emiliania huxleyi TaxID=2903 RepID=A0A7S3W6L3_EMIHU
MGIGLGRIRTSPSDAVVSVAASGASSAACAAARPSAALCLFSLGASAHSWCCTARRSPASRFALLVGGRACANSLSASPAAARLAAGTVCSASAGDASRNAAPRPSPSRWNGPPPPFALSAARAAAVSTRLRRRTRADSAWCGRPSLRQSHAPVGVGRGPDAMRHAPLQSLPNRNV